MSPEIRKSRAAQFVCEIPRTAGKVVGIAQLGTCSPPKIVIACENGVFVLTQAGTSGMPAFLEEIAATEYPST